MHRFAYLLWPCLFAACAEPTRDKPEPPDMSALVTAYASPTSNFDEAAARDVEALVEQKVSALADLDAIAGAIDRALGALAEDDAPAFAPEHQNLVLQGEGYARIERICSGHGSPAPAIDKDANGYLELTTGYSERGLDPVVFGGAVGCKEQASSAALVVDGQVNLYIGDNLTVDQLGGSPILFQLDDFALQANGSNVIDGGFDFQLCRGTTSSCVPGHFELLLGLPSGHTIVFFIDLASKAGGFRAANGVWTCDFLAGSCANASGATVTIPEYQL
ncbi:MAG TPA: hypothetical protein VFQ53_33965 [Kofleriaceae bacterium]|nr:hypothetical protein [Kofleriaceae bacterium]